MVFDAGLDILSVGDPLGFRYGAGVFGPKPEERRLDDIRKSLMDKDCDGPQIVYAIAMDVGKEEHRQALIARNLLFGAVTYARGHLGREPIRSQGHIHAVSPSCGLSTGELYELWEGSACIYMQETAEDAPGRCFAVMAEPGDVVLVPPGWAHCTISADENKQMSFGAWCVRDYGFDYRGVRAHGGLAFFPLIGEHGLEFVGNPAYEACECIVKSPRRYAEFGLVPQKPIYTQFEADPDKFAFIPQPALGGSRWTNFIP